MAIASNFYVYEHIRPDNGSVFYVGKGRGDRAFNTSKRNHHWKNVFNEAGRFKVSFLCEHESEEFVFLLEQERIDQLKKLGVALCNITSGGEGLSGLKFTDEHKQKIARAKLGVPRPGHVVEKMRKSRIGKMTGSENPFFGKRHTEETKAKLSSALSGRVQSREEKKRRQISRMNYAKVSKRSIPVYCVNNGITYFSISEAARQLNLHRRCITMVCNKEMHHTAGYKFTWGEK